MVEMVHHGCKFCYYQTQQLRCVRLVDAEGSSLKMTGRVIIYRFRFLVVKKLYVRLYNSLYSGGTDPRLRDNCVFGRL